MPQPSSLPPAGAYPAAKSNILLKLMIALVLIIFVGGALAIGGLWWAAQKIKTKAHEVAAEITAAASSADTTTPGAAPGNSTPGEDGAAAIAGDPCRFLSKEEVGRAVGLPILRTEAQDGGCNYIARGDPADITAKHVSAMLANMGAGAEAQQMAKKFAGGLFAQQEATDKDLSKDAAKGEIAVLALVFTSGHAAAEMMANRAGMEHISATAPAGSGPSPISGNGADLAGIGDEAFSAAGSMIMLRKGNVVVRMMYVSCPCSTDNIKPLARVLANRL